MDKKEQARAAWLAKFAVTAPQTNHWSKVQVVFDDGRTVPLTDISEAERRIMVGLDDRPEPGADQ